MSAASWGVLGIVAYLGGLWALGAYATFGRPRRRLYHRLFPRRAALDTGAWLLWPLIPIAIFLGTEYSTTVVTPTGPQFDWWKTIPLALCLFVYLVPLSSLTLRARAAKEPTYWQWTHWLPPRPDLAS